LNLDLDTLSEEMDLNPASRRCRLSAFHLSFVSFDEHTKDIGENVFFGDLDLDYKVYAFYYPGAMPNEVLEKGLRNLGEQTGKNLFVNIGRLDDPEYSKIAKAFELRNLPAIVVTAVADLASADNEYLTAYARLDGKNLLKSADKTIQCLQKLFDLFIRGEVSGAIRQAKWRQRVELLAVVGKTFTEGLKSLGSFVADRDISFSLVEGKFELKRSGD